MRNFVSARLLLQFYTVPSLVVSVVSVMATLAAVVLQCMETMPKFSGARCLWRSSVDPFFVGETVCTAWFTVEFLVRLASCPCKRSFFLDFKNVVDFVAVVPYYVSLWMESVGSEAGASGPVVCGPRHGGDATAVDAGHSLTYLRVLRLIRVVRIMKLSKYCLGLQVT